MQTETHIHRIIELAQQKGIIRPSDLDAIGAPRVALTRMAASGILHKIGRGIYHLPDNAPEEHESLLLIATKVPQAVFCLLSALQFHELTTQLPRQVWVGMPRGSHKPKIDYPPLKMIQYSPESYEAGIETHQCGKATLRVYSVAKTVVDCFKHRNTIGLDVALEALRDARASGRASMDELWRQAKICRVANVMRPYLEAIQ